MKFLRKLFAGLINTTAAKTAEPVGKSPADMMRAMRTAWLTRSPEKGIHASADEVVAVVMDWPIGNQTATVLSSSGGDASLYTTATFGILGGIGHEKVRKAAVAFVEASQRFITLTSPTTHFPYPDSETLTFYMVTPSGTRVVSFRMTDVEKADSPARVLFECGQQVLTELRQIAPPQE
ncbi:MAG: hypothetical protein JNN01_09770 [Opitutaceae bacterium]|nr:hypothetical protein [Opitutaceae bacterium]